MQDSVVCIAAMNIQVYDTRIDTHQQYATLDKLKAGHVPWSVPGYMIWHATGCLLMRQN
jgi:hypothetical protein